MRAELRRLQQELGIIFVHVTHGQDEALALADLVVVMNGGRIEQSGTPREVFEAPRTEFVARFIGGHNVVPTPAGVIAVRADRITLKRGRVDDARLNATVRGVEYQGASVHVALESAGAPDLVAHVADGAFYAAPFAPGDAVGVAWADADVHQLSPAA